MMHFFDVFRNEYARSLHGEVLAVHMFASYVYGYPHGGQDYGEVEQHYMSLVPLPQMHAQVYLN